MLSDRCGSHLVEQLITTSDDVAFESLLRDHLLPHLVAMCVDPIANFVLQRIILETRSPEQVPLQGTIGWETVGGGDGGGEG